MDCKSLPGLSARIGIGAYSDVANTERPGYDFEGSAASERERLQSLESVLRKDVLPRLGLLHHDVRGAPPQAPPDSQDIEEFGVLVIAPDAGAATAFFERMRQRGHSFETLFEHLLAPTARRLGELWVEDRCDFLEVTLGVGRLQELLDVFGSASEIPLRDIARRALLIATPVDSHCFGLEVVGAFLRGAAWDVVLHRALPLQDNLDAVADDWFGVAGVTMSLVTSVDSIARTIESVRRASRNPTIKILVGGQPFLTRPELVARVGADAAAPDGPTAVVLAKRLLARQCAAPREAQAS